MAELIKVNKKVINDPLFTPVIKFLQNRIANLEITGPADELALSKQRYDGLVAGDLIIESAITFPDGAVRVCIVSRKTGFARVDIDIAQVQMDDILTDFAVPLVEIDDVDHLKTYVKSLTDPVQPTLLYLKYNSTYGVLVTQDQAKTHEGPMQAFGNLFFESYVTERESENSIDWETLESGTVTISDASFGRGVYPLFIYELALSEAQLPEITSNLPTSVTTHRGESFAIPNTYWFSGTQDITSVATVELSTKSGYAILNRSSDLLEIDGETIYGSATKQIEDQIIVRVTYDWNGRLVHKNFTIQLIIEKDAVNDLVITATPSDVTATSGDTVQVTMTATYKGDAVEILIPPTSLKSQTGHSNLAYVKTNKDLSMVYQGKVTAQFAGEVTKISDLASGEFSYSDNGTVVKANGFINISIVKPDAVPEFTVTNVPTLIEGYINATGAYVPVVKYGNQVIPVTDVGITTGDQGTKKLLEITEVDAVTGINWKLIKDSATPGTPIRDTFTQTYQWLNPNGVLQTEEFVIVVQVDLDSIIEVVGAAPQPRNVKRYQVGGPTFTLMVNGVAQNDYIRSLSVDAVTDPSAKQYVINAKNQPNRWMVILAEDHEIDYTANFTFTAFIDNKLQTFHFAQEFIIAKYPPDTNTPVTPPDDNNPDNPGGGVVEGEEGTGPGGPDPIDNIDGPGEGDGPYNTNITAVPTSFTIAGNSDKSYQMTFKVYEGVDDITATSEVIPGAMVIPENITVSSLTYDTSSDSFVMKYYKNYGGEFTGAVFLRKKGAVDPLDKKDIARVWLNVNVVQVNVLKLIDPPSSISLNVDESKDLPVSIQFAGKDILLTDSNLSVIDISTGEYPNTNITKVNDESLTMLNNIWDYVGKTRNETMIIRFSYTNPVDQKVYTADLNLNIAITYPPMTLVYSGPQTIDAKIWDTGTFPIKLMAGSKDWTDAIIGTMAVSGNNYVGIKNLDWSVIFAEKTATSQIVGFKVYYTVGKSANENLPADFKFNLAAWDGVTFAADTHTPDSINANSGDKGEITASFVYKGNVATDKTVFALDKSSIPSTVILGTETYDADRKLVVIPYELTKGGTNTMVLVFTAPNDPATTTSISIDTAVAWPDEMNIITQGSNIRGFYQDTVNYPLTVNVAGVPVDLNDPNMTVTLSSGDDNPIQLKETLKDGLNVLLAKGGTLGTSYDYSVVISLEYANQSTGKVYDKTLTIPATIRVSAVKVGSNPVINADVFQHGEIPITLVDERNTSVAITSYSANGGGANVMFMDPNLWYVNSGPVGGSTTGPGTLPLRLGYTMGGQDYTIDVTEEFTINPWDGKYYRVSTSTTQIQGNAGDTGLIPFTFDYIGWPAPDSTLDLTRSVIPKNINIGELDSSGNVNYTLAGQSDLDLTLCFVRPNPSTPQVEGMDFVKVTLPVSTKSSNLPFTLVSNDDAITLDWSKSGTLKLKLKYGDNDVPANTPGLKYTLADADYHGITITGATKDGVTVKATRSATSGATTVYPENITVSYEVGAVDPKTVSFDASVTVNMGTASIDKNDTLNVVIWDTGTFGQLISFNGTDLPSVDHFEIRDGAESKYIEVTQPKSYEVIGAETTTTTQLISMTAYYKVDSTDVLQKLNFIASYRITGSTSVRFKVTPNPTKVEGSLDKDVTVTVTPVYKDKNVGGAATFKPDLSTIPAQLTLKDYKVVGTNYVLTFTGAKAGVSKMTLVFWSPDAGTNPKARDVASCDLDVQVMGELGIEIGNRDNLITGKNADTGDYSMQILFGGIPIDAAASIANGTLTVAREVGAVTSSNANVLTLNSWKAESFNYTLSGCVQPNATVNVSDFINLSYTYGGNKYTARVEIPLKYTSSAPIFDNWPTAALQVFTKGSLAPTATCDGITISDGIASISNNGDTADTYITLGGSAKTYEVIWAEKTQTTHNVSTRIVGQYRNWPWSVILDVPFTLAAWDQRTWAPTFSYSAWDVYLDLTGNAQVQGQLTAKYKAATYDFGSRGNSFDSSLSDLGGLISVAYVNTPNVNAQNYYLNAVKKGSYQGSIAWRRTDGVNPGTLDKDYGLTSININIKENSLYGDVGTGAAKGGSGDTVTGTLIVRDTGSKTAISNLNTNLVIAPVDEKVFKITSKAASTITVLVTADYTVADGVVNVPMTFTYTDPTTGYVTKGTFSYPFTIQRPTDWPVVTQTTAATTVCKLWSYGPIPFKVTVSGTDVSSQVVPTSCTDDSAGLGDPASSNYMQLSIDQPVTGTWWWITGKNYTTSQQSRTTKWKLTVPYRGTTVSVDGSFVYVRAGDGATPTPEFQGSTTTSKTLMQNVGDQTEIPFVLLWRNYKYSKGVFKPDLSGTDGAKFSDYFKVVSQRYDDTTGTTYLKIEMTQVYEGSMVFYWDTVDNLTNPVLGTNRVTISTSFYDLVVTDLTNSSWAMWNRRQISALMSIKDNGTELITYCQAIAVSNATLVPDSTTNNTFIRCKSDDATAAFSGNVVYTIQLPASYNRTIKVTIPTTIAAYDGNELVWSTQSYSNELLPATGKGNVIFYFNMNYRGSGVALADRFSSQALLRSANDDQNLIFTSIAIISPSNWVKYTFGSLAQRYGKIKLPVRYTGTVEKVYPTDTEGKNIVYMEIPVRLYGNALYIYPDDAVPAQVSGSFGNTVTVPVKFSVGLNVAENVQNANSSGMTESIVGSTVSGLVTYTGNSATGVNLRIDYDNRNSDIVLDVPLRATVNKTLNATAVASNRDWTQKVLIKGTGAGDTTTTSNVTSPSASVWGVGALPFSIVHNGVTIASSKYVSITLDSNGYVRTPETTPNLTTRAWEIYNGDTAASQHTVKFTVVFNDGVKNVTISQNVVFNIAAYDGIDLKVTMYNLSTFNSGLAALVGGNGNYLDFTGTYRGTVLTGTTDFDPTSGRFKVWPAKSNVPAFDLNSPASQAVGTSTTSPVYYYQRNTYKATGADMDVSKAGYIVFGLRTKETDDTAVEGKDYVKIPMPYYVYLANRIYVNSYDSTITGKFDTGTEAGTTYRFNYAIRKGLTSVQNNTVTTTLDPSTLIGLSTAANTGYEPVWFLKELTSAQQKTTKVKFTVNSGADTTLQSSFSVDVTQISNGTFPTVSELKTVETNLNQNGALPFKLTDDTGVDITSQATMTSITTNDYIQLKDGKWYCYNARTGDTTIKVTITYSITYKGKALLIDQDVTYLVKGFTSQPTVSNVQVISAKVWDKGSVIPFTINVSGNPVPSSWITAITGSSANGRVNVPSLTNPWQVISGDTTKASSDTVSYSVTVTNGTYTWTVTQDVVFNIAQYDGVEFKLSITNLNTDGVLLASAGDSARANIQGWYRGDTVSGTTGYTVKGVVTNANLDSTTPVSAINLSGSPKVYDFKTSGGKAQAYNVVAFYRPGISSGTVKDVDYCELVVPITSYQSGAVVAGSNPTSFKGKFGDVLVLTANVYNGSTRVALNDSNLSIAPSSGLGVEVVPNSITDNKFSIRFTADIAQEKVVNGTIDYTYGANAAVKTTFTTTQEPSDSRPVVSATGSMQSVVYGETGQIVLTGTYGSNTLAGNVTFVPESSDAKGLVTFGTPTTGDNGTVIIPVTGIKVGKDNLTIHIKVNGATGNTAGKDYLDITVAAEVTYASLGESEDFQTSGTGYQNTPVTLTQSVILPTDE